MHFGVRAGGKDERRKATDIGAEVQNQRARSRKGQLLDEPVLVFVRDFRNGYQICSARRENEAPHAEIGVPVDPDDVSVTVAVNVTESPKQDGFFDDVSAVDVEAAVTVRLPFT